MPVILVKNSRQEPIFSPLILSAIEEIDPALVSTIAVMVWDYEDTALQEYLISSADLVIAAASDPTIQEIDGIIQSVQARDQPIRHHQHGHKVSFTTIAAPYLEKDVSSKPPNSTEIIQMVTMLAAVDSIFWDQYGCLSSRVHFLERKDGSHYSAIEYGEFLSEKIRLLSAFLPRGALPKSGIHDRFDKFSNLTVTGLVHLCSNYDDDFLVIVDERPWDRRSFTSVVNDCIDRTIVVRPIDNIMEVPLQYLSWIPPKNLQTMTVAIDSQDYKTWSDLFTRFIEAIGERGVTGVRTVGRGPFPQLGYSWDGYLPLDLSYKRAEGRFVTVEFENTYQQILKTYEIFMNRGNLLFR
jgi:hypothetical protein